MKWAMLGCVSLLVGGCATRALDRPAVGTYYVDRSGHLEVGKADQPSVFRFDTAASSKSESIVLEPNSQLAMMQKVDQQEGRKVQFRINGVVTAKHTLAVEKAVAINPAAGTQ